jgi:signal peptidase II
LSFDSCLFRSRRKLFWAFAAATVLLDQFSKVHLWRHPLEGRPDIVLIPHVLRLISHEGNVRGALGLGPAGPCFYVVLTLVALLVVFGLFLTGGEQEGLAHAALGMVAGGAVGNLTDRLALGMVRDFVDLHWGEAFHWHTFNLADAAICVGFVLVVYDAFRRDGAGRAAGEDGT